MVPVCPNTVLNCAMSKYLSPSLFAPHKYLRQIPLLPVTFSYRNVVQANVNSHLVSDPKPSAFSEWVRLAAEGEWCGAKGGLELFLPTPYS